MESRESSPREAKIQDEIARLKIPHPQTGRSEWSQNIGNVAIFAADGTFIKFVVNDYENRNSSRTGSAGEEDLTLADIAVLSSPGSSQKRVD